VADYADAATTNSNPPQEDAMVLLLPQLCLVPFRPSVRSAFSSVLRECQQKAVREAVSTHRDALQQGSISRCFSFPNILQLQARAEIAIVVSVTVIVSLFLPYLDSVSVFLCGLISRFGRAWFIGGRVKDHGVYIFWVGVGSTAHGQDVDGI
jgi:hypothetical protein